MKVSFKQFLLAMGVAATATFISHLIKYLINEDMSQFHYSLIFGPCVGISSYIIYHYIYPR